MIPTFTVLGYDDWEALFVNDDLISQGHSVDLRELEWVSRGEPFRLRIVKDEKIGDYFMEHGQCYEHSLNVILTQLELTDEQ